MSRSMAKGTAWATEIVNYLKTRGRPTVERRAMNGSQDRGDIAMKGICIEAKNRREMDLAGAVDEAVVEGRRAEALVSVAWLHRRGKASAADGYVVMTGRQFVDLLEMAGL